MMPALGQRSPAGPLHLPHASDASNRTRQDGSLASLPHWAKWSEAYVADADAKLKVSYADRLPVLATLSEEWDPNGMFVNAFFKELLLAPSP